MLINKIDRRGPRGAQKSSRTDPESNDCNSHSSNLPNPPILFVLHK